MDNLDRGKGERMSWPKKKEIVLVDGMVKYPEDAGFNEALDLAEKFIDSLEVGEIVDAMPTQGTIATTRHMIAAAVKEWLKKKVQNGN